MNDQQSPSKEFRFPMYIHEDHVHEIDDYVHKQKQLGRKGKAGRPYNRTDYIREALEYYGKEMGLKTSPHLEP